MKYRVTDLKGIGVERLLKKEALNGEQIMCMCLAFIFSPTIDQVSL